MREPKKQASPFGWTATSDAEGTTVSLHDAQGRRRATWQQQERNARLQVVRLWPQQQHTVQIFDGADPVGEAAVDNGRPRPARRRDHDGAIALHGRRYDVRHTRRWRSTMSLDGRIVAVGRKGWFGRSVFERSQPIDSIDELALALFWFAVAPGRPGMIWMTFESV
ncbi:hypothetical protein ACFW9D_04420 [Streptomyces sp. NPDC059524]|uniref:hypothetical protein n=1 Tax=Streptomyces sp. NPDC059524 TaxID=3346856 RepID=UPI003679DA44